MCVLIQTQVNPQLNSSHKFSIDRKHKRTMVRAFTRGVKLTLWQHKAMWKDTALGTATLKCEDLETKAEVCDCGWVYICTYVRMWISCIGAPHNVLLCRSAALLTSMMAERR